ncbi:phage portal protein [Gordonia sp. DT219]|uniref:phage portal protein n=1 Tax=Gordonia sp. DT219 TaxID=3416658 RepID=UPI003CF7637E
MAAWPRGWKISRGRTASLDEPLTTEALSVLDKSVEDLWREQPYLRTVVTFLARNVAQLGLHTYRLGEDGGRERVRADDHPLAKLLGRPNPQTTTFEFVQQIVGALALYDRALVWVVPDQDGQPGELRVIPERWIVDTEGSTPFAVGAYVLQPDSAVEDRITVPASDVIDLHGWCPEDLRRGSSPVAALKSVLAEQISAQTYRQQLWDNGGRVGAYLTRPATEKPWTNEGRKRFKAQWSAAYSGNGKKVGGTPVLEDGMELKRVGFSAKEEDYVEGSKLALTTVASVYHVNPTMLGLLDNANYSNVREFRRMLYGDTLGPIIAMIEARLNADLVARFADAEGCYVEFNVRQKLEGSEEQMTQYVAAVNAGILMPSEVREMMNRPFIAGSDRLRRPLNMTEIQEESGSGGEDEN